MTTKQEGKFNGLIKCLILYVSFSNFFPAWSSQNLKSVFIFLEFDYF